MRLGFFTMSIHPPGEGLAALISTCDEVTLDAICDRLIIHGTPESVVDQLLSFQDEVDQFGTLLYAGKDHVEAIERCRISTNKLHEEMP